MLWLLIMVSPWILHSSCGCVVLWSPIHKRGYQIVFQSNLFTLQKKHYRCEYETI